MHNQKNLTIGVAIGILLVVFLLLFSMIKSVDNKVVLIIDSVELGNCDTITVGNHSDCSFKEVPKDFLIINQVQDSFYWKVNDIYHDTLQYFKINDENPNKFKVYDDEKQILFFNIPGDSSITSIDGHTVHKIWGEEFDNQKNILARHLLSFQILKQSNVTKSDSLKFRYLMSQSKIRSYFERKNKEIVIVILDESTEIKTPKRTLAMNSDGDTIWRYRRNGVTKAKGEFSKHCKVQFFKVNDYAYMDANTDDNFFKINGVNYVMKPSVKLTEWGAGHVMIVSKNNGTENRSLSLLFPKPITFVASIDTLRRKSERTNGILSLKQNDHTFVFNDDIYIPFFSGLFNTDICNIEFKPEGDSVLIKDNEYKSMAVKNKIGIVPQFSNIKLNSADSSLNCRVGFINYCFILSYLWLPFIVCCVLIALIWIPQSVVRVTGKLLCSIQNTSRLKFFPTYFTLMILIAFAYCICKSLITLKLSYTYPFFEKLTLIMPISTAMMLLLFFTFSMIINHKLTCRKNTSKLATLVVCSLLFLFLLYAFFFVVDKGMSKGMVESYFHSDVFTWKFWKWTQNAGINDTHRSVVYALFVIESVCLLIWTLLMFAPAIFKLRLSNKLRNLLIVVALVLLIVLNFMFDWHIISMCFNSIKDFFLLILNHLDWIIYIFAGMAVLQFIIATTKKISQWFLFKFLYDSFLGAAGIIFRNHLLKIILLIALGVTNSNFFTAFITLIVIWGLCGALSDAAQKLEKTDEQQPPHKTICEMLIITLIFMVCAMIGDNGYMTNYIGFCFCLVFFYMVVKRPSKNQNYIVDQTSKQEHKWICWALWGVSAIIILLPFISSKVVDVKTVNYNRLFRRMSLYSNFNELQQTGYRYNESDAEFMVIMNHYVQNNNGDDPLSNENHFLHPSVSTGQSPVVLNDLSVPVAFFGAFGNKAVIVYYLLLVLLIWMVFRFSIYFSMDQSHISCLSKQMQWRLLAVCMWVGTSVYIFLSYIDWLPFTGRLNPGLGVDAVGEVLESAFLFAFMCSILFKKK